MTVNVKKNRILTVGTLESLQYENTKIILIKKPVEEKVTTYTRSWHINGLVFPKEQQSSAATKLLCSKFL